MNYSEMNFDSGATALTWKDENFHYDKMNRLTDIYLGTTHSQIVYDPLGRMTTKQADGETVFANAAFAAAQGQPSRPHAMTSAETVEGVFPSASQEITYTGFDKVKTIAEGGNTLAYTYGHDQQRIRMVENVGDITRSKDYVGFCEFITEDDGENTTEKTLTYLVGPYGVFAVVEQQDNEEAIHYILKDHLGSWTTITDSEGNVEQELSFDAWGNLRDPETWSGSYSGTPMFDRGFTGHEHMTAFGLINMNGRCYDPLTSSFLSVDAYVQDPTSAQAFNRYAYCGYNPLRYTDPTGWYADGYGRQPQQQCYDPTARYHSDDPNDVLLGRSVHPCGNSSSGYINGTAVTSTGYTEGNSGLQGSNYTVDRQGYVKYEGGNNTTYDVLYSADAFYSGDFSNGLIVYDLSILSGLTEERLDYWSWGDGNGGYGNYTATESIDEAFKVYDFMTHNTNVEWEINGFRTNESKEYVINTTHFPTKVKQITTLKCYSDYNLIFRMHNHTLSDGTKGASGDRLRGDMNMIMDLHEKQFQGKDIHQWHVYNGITSKFPSHYLYHNATSVLYYYTPTQNSIYIRKVKSYKDLYRNLGF